jgi:hypothetical protein
MPLYKTFITDLVSGERIFRDWLKHGSLTILTKMYYDEGLRNPNTGKQLSIVSLSDHCWRWSLENFDYAKKIAMEANVGIKPEVFDAMMAKHAFTIYVSLYKDRQSFYNWLQAHNLEKYRDYKSNKSFFEKKV